MRNFLTCSIVVFAAALVVGCTSSSSPPAKDGAKAPVKVDPAAVMAKLKAADVLDGKEDHVVSKCYMCGLAMEGEANYAAEYEGYTVHLCSDHCKENFEKDPASVIAQTTIPAAETK